MLTSLLERLQEAYETPWSVVTPFKLGGALVAVVLVCLVYLVSEEQWVFLLDDLNLVFHEAGHPIFGIFGHTIGFLGGTIMQLLVPLVVAASACYKRQAVATALACAWCCQNGFNIARYVADARSQLLPLVGGGEHDWATLLGEWGLLHKDQIYAQTIRTLSWLGIFLCCAWLVWRLVHDRRQAAT